MGARPAHGVDGHWYCHLHQHAHFSEGEALACMGAVPSRRFHLQRDTDVTGISGTGTVADGVRFPDGVCVIRWRGERQSTVVWPSVEDVEAIHGHGGATRIVWDD